MTAYSSSLLIFSVNQPTPRERSQRGSSFEGENGRAAWPTLPVTGSTSSSPTWVPAEPSQCSYHGPLCVQAIEARSVDQEKEGHVNSFTLAFRDSDKERQYQVQHIIIENLSLLYWTRLKLMVKIFRRIETLGFQHHLLAHSSSPFSWEASRF